MVTKLSLPSHTPVLSVWIEHPDLDNDSALSCLLTFLDHIDTLRSYCFGEPKIGFAFSWNGKVVPEALLDMIRNDGSPIEEVPSCTTLAIPVTTPR